MSCVLDTAFNVSNPARHSIKRKRKLEANLETNPADDACFVNAAFSSTPNKKLVGRRRKLASCTEESTNPFLQNPCLEVKSIAEIVKEAQNAKLSDAQTNPYEVVRKRKKTAENACFENVALNLELPEKQFNPYEVLRQPLPTPLNQPKGHINAALNIRGQDVPASRNPFEIMRCSAASVVASSPAGVENLGMTEAVPTNLKIGIPFTPTMGCRIDFKNLPLAQLTPSKLLLAEKLVFSPVPGPKRSLGAINEESSMDIGRELDRYQLELENSINEAKFRKNCGESGGLGEVQTATAVVSLQVELDQRIPFTQKLAEITEGEDEAEVENVQEIEKIKQHSSFKEHIDLFPIQESQMVVQDKENNLPNEKPPHETAIAAAGGDDNLNGAVFASSGEDVAYASDSDEEEDLDFKVPAPFVRAYRRASSPKLTVSKESLNSLKSDKSVDSIEQKKLSNVKNLIRKSIRKLMHPNQSTNLNKEIPNDKPEKSEKHSTNIIASIRQSLRRKPSHKHLIEEEQEQTIIAAVELSIIDSSERRLKLKAPAPETSDTSNEKKHSLRHSLRQSTRELRQQVMKSVFHKNQEEYAFSK